MSNIRKLFSRPDKGLNEPGINVLPKFLRSILDQSNISIDQLFEMVNKWMDDPANNVAKDTKTRSYVRGNLLKAIAEPDMTWKTFMTALALFRPSKIELTIKLHLPKRTRLGKEAIYEHTLVIPVEDIDMSTLSDNDN